MTRESQELQSQDVAGLLRTKNRIHEMRRGLNLMDQGIDVVLGALGVRVDFEPAESNVKLLDHTPRTNGVASKAIRSVVTRAVKGKRRGYRKGVKNERPLSSYVQEFLERNGPASNGQITDGVLAMGYRTVTKRKKFTGSIGSCLSVKKFPKRDGLYAAHR